MLFHACFVLGQACCVLGIDAVHPGWPVEDGFGRKRLSGDLALREVGGIQ